MAGKTMGQTETELQADRKQLFSVALSVRLDVFREPFLYDIIETVFVK